MVNSRVRSGIRWLALAPSGLIVMPLVTEFVIELAREKGAFDHPSARLEAVMSGLSQITGHPYFPWIAGIILGFTVGVWLDALLRRREDLGPLASVSRATLESFSTGCRKVIQDIGDAQSRYQSRYQSALRSFDEPERTMYDRERARAQADLMSDYARHIMPRITGLVATARELGFAGNEIRGLHQYGAPVNPLVIHEITDMLSTFAARAELALSRRRPARSTSSAGASLPANNPQ